MTEIHLRTICVIRSEFYQNYAYGYQPIGLIHDSGVRFAGVGLRGTAAGSSCKTQVKHRRTQI